MSLFQPHERAQARALATLVYGNPFLPERIDAERQLLGDDFTGSAEVWSYSNQDPDAHPNIPRITAIANRLCHDLRQRLIPSSPPSPADAQLYEDAVIYMLYYRFQEAIGALTRQPGGAASIHLALQEAIREWLGSARLPLPTPDPAHLLACFFQVRRAFSQIFHSILGASHSAARLRAAVWQSVFTHDTRRYRRVLYNRTGDFTTLITGESGTGKELVARAVALSRYIPYDPRQKAFTVDTSSPADDDSFLPLNLAALSPTLIESELFGHKRGAFTGAVEDRTGYLEACPAHGTVFLDEIGDLDPAIQVKLLRVLQERTFTRLGETRPRRFVGKLVAATHQDLAKLIGSGHFRSDFYYRLCSDVIRTSPLREQIAGQPERLRPLITHIARRLTSPPTPSTAADPGPDSGDTHFADADRLTEETLAVIGRRLGPDYAWPGNFRELEQCVRNVLVRGDYLPHAHAAPADRWLDRVESISLTADELLTRYCAHAYGRLGSFQAVARRLDIDRRTVAARVSGSPPPPSPPLSPPPSPPPPSSPPS